MIKTDSETTKGAVRPPNSLKSKRRVPWRFGCWLLLASAAFGADTPKKAEFEVSGLGWLRNRELRISLERLLGDERGTTLDANAIEDAALLLQSSLHAEGFLKPTIEIEFSPNGGEPQRFTFDPTLSAPLPRPITATAVSFHVQSGVRYVVEDVEISGLTVLPNDDARDFFRPQTALIARDAARAYTPARLANSLESLQEELHQRGYAEAVVRSTGVQVDDATGNVSLRVEVNEGPRWMATSLRFDGAESTGVHVENSGRFLNHPWSALWQQDVSEAVRQAFYRQGYPDVQVRLSHQVEAENGGIKPVAVTAAISPGPQVRVGQVRFEGNVHTRESVLRRRVRAEIGGPLNPLALERARYRLGRLGVFESVDLRYEDAGAGVRDAVFTFRESRLWEANLLFGYGSYEQVRGGVEFRQMNLFGRAHQSRLELVQSMKSTRADYTYTVPELFGETIDGTARLFLLQREERSFERQELGATVLLKRSFPRWDLDASVGYTFQALRSNDNQLGTRGSDDTNVTVASVDFVVARDRRDNPLRPRRGYRWFVQPEFASRGLGGEADYQRVELGAAYHTSWGRARWVHVGLSHGVITTQGAENDRLLPVNKRFFPGGDSSIRGYQSGEAAPRGADGRFIGAKSYALVNVEVEQAVLGNWSAVIFVDALGVAARLAEYPFDEELYSAGLGVRYQTLIGPVRVEYGHNLNRRADDPSGTLHLSVGFPF